MKDLLFQHAQPRTFGDLSRSRQNHFDALRLVLALAVLYTHSYGLTKNTHEWLLVLTGYKLAASDVGLFGFFLISGFLIAGSWQRSRSPADFAVRRARRIFPGFVVAVVLCFAVAGPLGADSVRAYFHDPMSWNFLGVLLMRGDRGVPAAFAANPIPGSLNGSLWTIRLELSCYALTALAGGIGLLRNKGSMLLATVLVIGVGVGLQYTQVGRTQRPLYVWGMSVMTIPFAIGTTAYVWREHLPASVWLLAIAVAALLVTRFTGGIFYCLWPAGGYILLLTGLLPGNPALLRRVGDLSYGVYLYAFPVQQLFIRYLHAPGPGTLIVVVTPVTFALAWLSWTLVEKPFLGRRRTDSDRHVPD